MDPVLYIADTVRPERHTNVVTSLVEDWTNQENISRLVDNLSKDAEQAEAFAGALSSALSFMRTDFMMESYCREKGYDSSDRIISLAMRLPMYSAELGLAGLYLEDGPLASNGQVVRERIDDWQAQYDALEEMVVGWFVARDKGALGSLGGKLYNLRLAPRFVREMIAHPVKEGIQSYEPSLLTITGLTGD